MDKKIIRQYIKYVTDNILTNQKSYLSDRTYVIFMKGLSRMLNIDHDLIRYEQDWSEYKSITFRDAMSDDGYILCVPPKTQYRLHYNSGKKMVAGGLMYMYINDDVQSASFDQFIYKLIYYGMIFFKYYKAKKFKILIKDYIDIVICNFIDLIEENDIDVQQLMSDFQNMKRALCPVLTDVLKKESLSNGCPKICTKGSCDHTIKRSLSKMNNQNAKKTTADEEFFVQDSPYSVRKTAELFYQTFGKKISIGHVNEIKKRSKQSTAFLEVENFELNT